MKKLMIAAFAVAFAAVAQAAQVTWNSGTITMPDGTTATTDSVTGYLFVLTATEYSALQSAEAVWNMYGDKLASADSNVSSTALGAIKLVDNTKNYSTGDTAYAAFIYMTADESQYNATYSSWTFTSTSNKTMSNTFSNSNASGWTEVGSSVPEPTSALMLLVGLAGLALRRKQA